MASHTNMARDHRIMLACFLAFITILGVILGLIGMMMHYGMCELKFRMLRKQVNALIKKLDDPNFEVSRTLFIEVVLKRLALKSFCD